MPAYLSYKVVGGDCFVWEHGRGNSVTAPINISTLAAASLGAGSDDWASVSWNGEWIIIRTSRADGAGWDALYIASMATFPASLDFHAVKVNTWNYNPSSIHRVSNDGLTVYGIYDSDSDQVSKFTRASTAVYDFVPITMYSGTNSWEMVSLSLDETYLTVAVGYDSDFYRVNTTAPYTATLLFDVSTQAIHTTHSSSPTSDNRLVFEGDGAGGDESTYVLQTLNPSESYTDISGVGNDNDPFCLANDNNLVVSLYLSRPGNSSSAHELIFRDIDGANEVAPASFHGVNVVANTISGFTLSPGGVDGSGDVTANDASAAGAGTVVGPVTGAGIAVQRGTANVPNTGGSASPGVNFGSLASTIVFSACNRRTNLGWDSSTGNMEIDGLSGGVHLSAVDTIDFDRESTATSATARFNWESWEYTGAGGGDNEFIVRGRYKLTLAGESATQAVSGVSNIDDCIPFITGILVNNGGGGNDADSATAVAWMSAAGTLNVKRGSGANNTVQVYVTVVEFTGGIWAVKHGYIEDNADSGVVVLRDAADGVTVGGGDVIDWGKAAIFHQYKANNLNGTDDSIADTSATYYPGGSTTQVNWNFHSDHVDSVASGPSSGAHFVHVLVGSLLVSRFTDTQALEGVLPVAVSGAAISGTGTTAVEVSRSSSGTGTAYGRGWVGWSLASPDTLELWAHRRGNTISTRIQVIDFAPAINGGGSTGAGVAIAADASATGTGGKTAVGSGAAQADSSTASGAGNKAIIGSGSPVAISSTASGTGAAVGVSTGIGNVSADNATASGTGTKQATGIGSAVADAATASGVGGVVGVVTGTGDAVADNAAAAGAGAKIIVGAGDAISGSATASGAGAAIGISTGVGDATADSATATGAGAKTAVGAGAAIAGTATASGSGWRYIVGAGDVFADTATAYGTDVIPVTITSRNIIFARRPDMVVGAINRRTDIRTR